MLFPCPGMSSSCRIYTAATSFRCYSNITSSVTSSLTTFCKVAIPLPSPHPVLPGSFTLLYFSSVAFIYACHAISVLVAQYLRMTKMMRNVHIPLISLTKFFSFYFLQSKLYSRVGNFWDVQIIISNKVLFGIILSSFLEFGNITLIKGSSN